MRTLLTGPGEERSSDKAPHVSLETSHINLRAALARHLFTRCGERLRQLLSENEHPPVMRTQESPPGHPVWVRRSHCFQPLSPWLGTYHLAGGGGGSSPSDVNLLWLSGKGSQTGEAPLREAHVVPREGDNAEVHSLEHELKAGLGGATSQFLLGHNQSQHVLSPELSATSPGDR